MVEGSVEGQDNTAKVADGGPAASAPPEDLDGVPLPGRAQAGNRGTCRRALQRITMVDALDGDAAAAPAIEHLDALEDRLGLRHRAGRLAAAFSLWRGDGSGPAP